MSIFLRVVQEQDKGEALRGAIGNGARHFNVRPAQLRSIPGSPFAYWISDALRGVFGSLPPVAGHGGRAVKQGLASADDFRFVRLSWEVALSVSGSHWQNFAKGGRRSLFYNDVPTLVNWNLGAGEIRANVNERGETRSNIRMLGATEREFFFRPGVTWPLRGIEFSAQAVPAETIFSNAGKMAFGPDPALLLAVLNSRPFDSLVGFFAGKVGGVQYEVGLIGKIPFPDVDGSGANLSRLARRGWSLRRSLDTCSEVSHAFVVPAVLQVEGATLADRVGTWSGRVAEVEAELDWLQSKIDELCFELYGISDEDRAAITEGFGVTDSSEDEGSDDDVGDDAEPVGADPSVLAAGLVSWAVGVGVGRFDVRLAIGGREWSAEPDPFDPLPVCSPAMLTGEDGLPVGEPPVGYPVSVSPVLVDDRGHELDIIGRVRAVFDVVFGADADSWWADTGEALGARRGEISSWLRKGFFGHHLKSHSKSRRKAPILWPIGTASGSHVVWLYAHRVTADSLFQVLNDIVDPKLRAEQRHLTELTQEAGPDPSAGQREALDAQETLVGELRELRDELEAVTPLWAPDLNDGIVIVLAPLWRLFAHHRPWSRELKKHWDKLTAGDYDWAQLAMHLWPERVIPKCAKDRSLAIAHGLEDVFWIQDPNNTDKWHPRPTPTTPIDQLIAERHKPATKAALQQATP